MRTPALPSAAKMKSCAFSCSFKTFNSPWKDMTSGVERERQKQQHKGEMNDTIVGSKHQSYAQYFEKKQCIFVCVSEVTNNTCDWLYVVHSHYSKSWSKSDLNCGPVARQLSSLDMVVSFSFTAWQEPSEKEFWKTCLRRLQGKGIIGVCGLCSGPCVETSQAADTESWTQQNFNSCTQTWPLLCCGVCAHFIYKVFAPLPCSTASTHIQVSKGEDPAEPRLLQRCGFIVLLLKHAGRREEAEGRSSHFTPHCSDKTWSSEVIVIM